VTGGVLGGIYSILGNIIFESSKNVWLEHRLNGMETSKYKMLIVSKSRFVPIEEIREERAKRKKAMNEFIIQNKPTSIESTINNKNKKDSE
jgi:hypothetical protein